MLYKLQPNYIRYVKTHMLVLYISINLRYD